VAAAACLLGSESIHTAVMPSHFGLWWATGAFFLAISLLEGLLAAALLIAPSQRLAEVVVAVSIGTVALWAWSRTVGVPLGPDAGQVEGVGRADVLASLLELATVVCVAPLARGSREALRWTAGPQARLATALVVAAVAALTAYGVGDDGHVHGAGHAAHRAPAPINGS
jgi:hypothetical protein